MSVDNAAIYFVGPLRHVILTNSCEEDKETIAVSALGLGAVASV